MSPLYSSVVVTKTVRPRKPEIFTIWSFMERVNVRRIFSGDQPKTDENRKNICFLKQAHDV